MIRSPKCYVAYMFGHLDHILNSSVNWQEQCMAAQIVQVVIAGNSVEIPRGLLNGQVRHLICHCIIM